MFRKVLILAMVGVSLALAGCSTMATTPPAAVQPGSASTAAPTLPSNQGAPTSQPASTDPALTSTQGMPTSQPATAGPVASSTQAAPAASGTLSFVVQPGTEARYRVKEQLASRSLPSDAVGTTQAVSGVIVARPDGTIVRDQSKVTIDLQTLRSDESRRDNYISRNTLATSQYPTVEFVPTEVRGLPSPLPASGQAAFELVGDLTIHGVTKPVTWQVNARLDGQNLTGTANTSIKFEDFGMKPPQVFVVLSVEDNIRLETDFKMLRQS